MYTEIENAITSYITARRNIIEVGNKYPSLFSGNDNIIGRIGEFYALMFLLDYGQQPSKILNASNPGFDLIDEKTGLKTQVKVITAENKLGRTVQLKDGWDQLLLIILDSNYDIESIGVLQHDKFEISIKENPTHSRTPYIRKSMLGPKGIFGRYGTVIDNYNLNLKDKCI
ncbi:hypothetical protein [Vallitalea okinawensis]|uniref:hypothetical protein n=1 Tax=Vallitalea okinawensis TaxID=2078660 RepID=UPI000CFA8367|nr:hypothetical protein [Vallitalea okinawensis]